jgi:hypothetical protein
MEEEKKKLTEEMRRQVDDFLERKEAVGKARNESERKRIIRGYKSEGRYELSGVKDYAIMGLQPRGIVISYMLAKKDVVFKVTKGTREQLEASLQQIESILAEYELDEGAKTYFERIRDALSRTIESRKNRGTRKPGVRGGEEQPTVDNPENPQKGGEEQPTVDNPENPPKGGEEQPTVDNPENPPRGGEEQPTVDNPENPPRGGEETS